MPKIAERINKVKSTIADACDRVGRDVGEVKLLIVTKAAELNDIKEVIRLGYKDLGESRAQRLKKVSAEISEFLYKNPQLAQDIRWHMIGHLQRNKVKHVLPIACMIHSLDTLRLAEQINSRGESEGIKAKVLLQVNTSQEEQKYGLPVGAVTHLAEQLMTFPNIELHGLMTMGPLTKDRDFIRSCFRRARELFEELRGKNIAGPEFKELSMGMSSDYEIAVEEGATIVRIGSAIFSE